jgi:hypothetical protein
VLEFLPQAGLLIIVALAALRLALSQPQGRVLALYTAFGAAAVLLTGKLGSGVNYLLELCLGLVLVVICLYGAQLDWPVRPNLRRELVLTLLFAQLLVASHPLTPATPTATLTHEARLVALVRAVPGEVLGEPMGTIVQAGKRLWTEPFVSNQLAAAGTWDQAPLLAMIRQHRFGGILMDANLPPEASSLAGLISDCWNPALLQVVDQEYHITDRVDGVVLLRPRTR